MPKPEVSLPHRASWLGTFVATLLGNLYLVVATLLLSIVALAASWVPPRGRVVFRVARWWSRGVLFFSGVALDTQGQERLDPAGSYILVSNHQSLFDIPALLASVPVETRFMAKRSLFRIPLFGWALRAGGFVSIDRTDRGRSRSAFTDALKQLRGGASVLVFPEGTRSFDGRLLPFKRGGLLLALRSRLPIVPVGVSGTLEVRRRDSWLMRPGCARVRFGDPIEPGHYGISEIRGLEQALRDEIGRLAQTD